MRTTAALFLAFVLPTSACGSDDDAPSEPDTSTTGGSSTSTAMPTSADATTSPIEDTTSSGSAGTSSTSGGGGTVDGSDGTASETTDGSGTTGVPGVVQCGADGLTCSVGGSKCCSDEEIYGEYSCAPENTECAQNYFCDGPEDCSDGPCCTYFAQPGVFYAACWPEPNTSCIRPCHGDADCEDKEICCPLSGHEGLSWCTSDATCS